MADNNLLTEKAKILEQIKRIQSEQGVENAKLDTSYIKLKGRLEEIVKVLKGFVNEQNRTVQGAVDLERGAKSLGTIYSGLATQMRQQAGLHSDIASGIKLQLEDGKAEETSKGNQQTIVNDILAKYRQQSSLANELAELTSDDIVAKGQLRDQLASISEDIKSQTGDLDKRTNVAKVFLSTQNNIEASINEQIAGAEDLASLSQEQKDILEQQAEVFDSMKKKVDALGSTLTTFLKRPQAAIGALVIGIGKFAGKFGEVNRELGQSFTQGLNASTLSATGLGFIFEDTAGTVRELASEFGGVDAATLSTQANIGLMATNMGITNKEAVGLTASFARLNGSSTDVAADMIKTTQEFANQNGLVPAALMADLAGSTEEFALFGKDGGKNILEAAGYAAKLGTNMGTISGIADGLLDFESSITKELELGAMLGKNINLDKARQLAMEGDLDGMMKETLKSLGGIDAFNKMDYFQKKATADLLGVSVAEMQKMATNAEKAGSMGEVMNSSFSKAGEFLNTGLNKYLGTGIQGLGGMITMTGQVGTGFSAMGTSIGGVIKGTGKVLKNMLSMGGGAVLKGLKAAGGFLAGTPVGKKVGGLKDKLMSGVKDKFTGAGDASPKKGGMPGKGIMDGMSKINMSAVLKGAAAMLVVAAAVFVFGKAVQEFMKVSWSAVGMAVVSMLALVGAVALLGVIMMSGVGAVAILAGAAAMLVVAAAVLVLGIGLQAIGTGFEMLGAGISSLTPNLLAVGTSILGMVTLLPMIGFLSLGLIGLAGSLAYLALFGTLALPALIGIGAAIIMAGLGVTMLGNGLLIVGAGLQNIGNSISGIGDIIGNLITFIEPIMALSLALTAFAGSLFALSIVSLVAIPALMGLGVAMMIAGLGVTILGNGLSLVGAGLQTISNSISGIGDTIAGVGDVIGNIITFIGPIMALSLALTTLAASLMLVSVAGITALPGLLAIAAIGAIAVGIGGLLGVGDESAETDVSQSGESAEGSLLAEIKGLREDLISGKVGVYMDGSKVTAAIAKVVDKVGSNSYAI